MKAFLEDCGPGGGAQDMGADLPAAVRVGDEGCAGCGSCHWEVEPLGRENLCSLCTRADTRESVMPG